MIRVLLPPLPPTLALVLSLALSLAPTLTTAAPGEASPTLRKIQEAGVITLGYRDASVPFSYLDDAQRPIGYSMAICDRVVDAIKARLGLRDLERRYVAVASATRIALVANGTVDIECGITTHTAERQRRVAFSITTFVAASRVVSKKAAPVRVLDDLRGKVVTSTVGTTSIGHLQALTASRGIEMDILPARDDLEAFRLLATGRADAYAMDDVLLRAAVATARQPSDYVISNDSLSVEPYALVLPKDDPEFKRVVDQAITALYRSGEILPIYRQWFLAPIPPRGVNLNLPMHPAMQRVIDHPTDSPDPEKYR